MDSLRKMQELVVRFRDERDWQQFHNPKDCAISLMLEAAEVLEHFQWKSRAEMDEHVQARRDEIGDELADVLYWVLLLGNDLSIDIPEAFVRKLKKSAEKYPVERAKGKHTKYTEL